MRIGLILIGAALLAGCDQPEIENPGEPMWSYFPFDGVRTWEFISSDMSLTFKRKAAMRSTEPDVLDGVNTYPIDYHVICVQNDPDCVTGVERSLSWSSDKVDGVYIWEWTEGQNPTVYFDPPLHVADAEMKVGEVLTTETAGYTFTSTLTAFEECPIRYQGGPAKCARITISDGDDDPETGKGLVGDYWAGTNYNIVGFQFPEDEGVWQLSSHVCDDCAADNGRW